MKLRNSLLLAAFFAGAMAMAAAPPTGKDLRWERSPQIAELSGCTPGCTPGVGSCPSGGCVDLCPDGRTLTVQGIEVVPAPPATPSPAARKSRFRQRSDCTTSPESFQCAATAIRQSGGRTRKPT